MTAVRIALPAHLRTLAGVGREVTVQVAGEPTVTAALDALERAHPVLRGTIRDRDTRSRRAFIRYLACGRDLSLDPDAALPEAVADGTEALAIVGAIAGG